MNAFRLHLLEFVPLSYIYVFVGSSQVAFLELSCISIAHLDILGRPIYILYFLYAVRYVYDQNI